MFIAGYSCNCQHNEDRGVHCECVGRCSESLLILCAGSSNTSALSSIGCHYLAMLDPPSCRAPRFETPRLPRMGWMDLRDGMGCLLDQSPLP
jgi:hypothetical protein